MRKFLFVFLLIASLVLGAASSGNQEGKALPSKSLETVNRILEEKLQKKEISDDDYRAERTKLILEELSKLNTKGLNREELFIYGNLLRYVDRTDEAKEIYCELAKGDDLTARKGAEIAMYIFSQDKDFETVEKMYAQFRSKFKPVPEDIPYTSTPVSILARHYSAQGNHEKAIKLLMEEVESLPFDAPYRTFSAFAGASYIFLELGRKDEALELLARYQKKFEEIVGRLKEDEPEEKKAKAEYDQRTQLREFARLVRTFETRATTLRLINQPAPPLKFIKFFNTEPITLENVKGKVTLLNFWANW